MDAFFGWVESSALSDWVRGSESIFAFPTIITLHAIGMGFLAGGSAAIDLRILGIAPSIPLKSMQRFLPVLWLAFTVNAISGTLLLIAYPTKALTNPLFYVKLGLIALGVTLVYRIGATVLRTEQEPASGHAKALALASLATWVALILAGRFLGYTHRWEMLGIPAIL
jgi:hypothetical protein